MRESERETHEKGRKAPPSAKWLQPNEIAASGFSWAPGSILLGASHGSLIGVADDRHIVTIAGSRAGKSRTSLLPNLMLWPGSFITIDPKGELANETAPARAKAGHQVYVIDPFEQTTGEAAKLRKRYNPLAELLAGDPADHVDDAALMADAFVVTDGRSNDHWTTSARNLIQGMILWLISSADELSLIDLRDILSSSPKRPDGDETSDKMNLGMAFDMMAASDAYDGVVANVGASFEGKPENEAASIISSAVEQLAFLRSSRLGKWIGESDFKLRDLKERPTSIYLVLPASRMATHFRWLRLLIMQAMNILERVENRTQHPVLFVLEEFPTLGYMRQVEAAAGLMAGYQVKLWTVMQDLSQIKSLYPNSWETFLGNAGIVEAFGNVDVTTTEYISKRLGNTQTTQLQRENLDLQAKSRGAASVREQAVSVPLLAPFEVTQQFSRKTGRKLLLPADDPPFFVERTDLKRALELKR